VLCWADGVVLTCRADPLSLRTIPTAAAIQKACLLNARLNLLGLAIAIYKELDGLQWQLLRHLRQVQPDLLLEPPIPYQQEIRHWPLHPGSPLPPGPAHDSYASLAGSLEAAISNVAAV